MQILNGITYFLFHSNLVISCSGGFLTYGIARHFSIEHSSIYAFLVALLIFSVYTLQRIADKSGFPDSGQSVWGSSNLFPVTLSILSLISAVIIGIMIFRSGIILIVLTLFFSFLCYWYTIPFFGKKLREIPGIKIIATAATWSYSCAFFPLVNGGISLEQACLFSSLLLLYFAAIILPFDMRDVHTDHLNQSTIPQMIGIPATKLFGTFLLAAFLAGNLFYGIISPDNWIFFTAVLLQLLLLLLTSEKKNYLYFGWIDVLIFTLGISYLF